jgi:hypothetical protein
MLVGATGDVLSIAPVARARDIAKKSNTSLPEQRRSGSMCSFGLRIVQRPDVNTAFKG